MAPALSLYIWQLRSFEALLVLMQALDLHVEDRICVECHALRLFDVGGKVELVGALDLVEPREHRAIAGARRLSRTEQKNTAPWGQCH